MTTQQLAMTEAFLEVVGQRLASAPKKRSKHFLQAYLGYMLELLNTRDLLKAKYWAPSNGNKTSVDESETGELIAWSDRILIIAHEMSKKADPGWVKVRSLFESLVIIQAVFSELLYVGEFAGFTLEWATRQLAFSGLLFGPIECCDILECSTTLKEIESCLSGAMPETVLLERLYQKLGVEPEDLDDRGRLRIYSFFPRGRNTFDDFEKPPAFGTEQLGDTFEGWSPLTPTDPADEEEYAEATQDLQRIVRAMVRNRPFALS